MIGLILAAIDSYLGVVPGFTSEGLSISERSCKHCLAKRLAKVPKKDYNYLCQQRSEAQV